MNERDPDRTGYVDAIVRTATRRGYAVSDALVRSVVPDEPDGSQIAARLAELGVVAQVVPPEDLEDDLLPVVVLAGGGSARIIERMAGGAALGLGGRRR